MLGLNLKNKENERVVITTKDGEEIHIHVYSNRNKSCTVLVKAPKEMYIDRQYNYSGDWKHGSNREDAKDK